MTAAEPARLLLVEDHPMFRLGLRQAIEAEGDLAVGAEAATYAEALQAARTGDFDLALVDVTLPDGSGLNLPADLRAARVSLPVLMVSMHDARAFAEQALAVGARGFVSKSAPPDALVEAIRAVLAGEAPVEGARADHGETRQIGLLSDREREVFEGLGQGQSTRAIAEKLGIGIKTVETHQIRIRRKLDLADAAVLRQLAAVWVARGCPPALSVV